MKDLDQKRIRELFTYDGKTGELRWQPRPLADFPSACAWKIWNKRYAGSIAGYILNTGHRIVTIGRGRAVLAHRIAWMYTYGEWPNVTDHINGIRDDNRLINLRSVTQAENARNQARSKTNKSGVTGVRWFCSKWYARISFNGKEEHLGLFDNKEEAIAARKAAEARLGFHPNHGRAAA